MTSTRTAKATICKSPLKVTACLDIQVVGFIPKPSCNDRLVLGVGMRQNGTQGNREQIAACILFVCYKVDRTSRGLRRNPNRARCVVAHEGNNSLLTRLLNSLRNRRALQLWSASAAKTKITAKNKGNNFLKIVTPFVVDEASTRSLTHH